jgi:hypothetical protein
VRADLDRHAAGDLAHRRQERQTAAHVGHRLVGDAGGARFDQPLGLRLVGGEVEIGEEDLALAQRRDLGSLRLLDLDDHVGGGEDCLGVGRDLGPGRPIGVVGKADPGAGAGLHHKLVAVMGELADAARDQADPVFVRLYLLRDTDQHDYLL